MKMTVPAYIGLAALANATLSYVNMSLDSPLFFDSIFTAIIGALFGPIAGIATGLTSHLVMEAFHSFNGMFLPFALCNMATGLIVGAFAIKGVFKNLYQAISCTLLVTIANAVLGAVIAFFVFGGPTHHASDNLVTALLLAGGNLFSASFWARIPANLIDKGIAVLAAFAIVNSRFLGKPQSKI